MPNKVNAWEHEGFVTRQEAMYVMNILWATLPKSVIPATEYGRLINSAKGIENVDIENIIQADENGEIKSNSKLVKLSGMAGPDGIVDGYKLKSTINDALNAQAQKRNDARIKTFYSNLAYINTESNGSMVRAMMESPYVYNLFNSFSTLLNNVSVSSSELKAGLGVPVYETIMDFQNDICDEIKVEYYRQQDGPFKSGTLGEQTYLERLKEAHDKLLRSYTKLSQLKNDPQNINSKYLGSNIESFYGVNTKSTRNYDGYLGMIRGESKAIENGWGANDLYVLGVIGSVEAGIRRLELYGDDTEKNAIKGLKSELMRLKKDCYYTIVDTSDKKLEIANQVNAFIEKYSQDAVNKQVRDCMADVVLSKDKMKEAITAIKEEVALDNSRNTSILKKRIQDPKDYLDMLYTDALSTGDYKLFVLQCMEFKKSVETEYEEGTHEYAKMYSAIEEYFDPSFKDASFIQQGVAEAYYSLSMEKAQFIESIASDIREGREEIDPTFKFLKADYGFSRRYATRMMEETALNRTIGGIKEYFDRYKEAFHNEAFLEDVRSSVINQSTDILTLAERKMFLESGLEADKSLAGYGVDENGLGVDLKPNDDDIVDQIRKDKTSLDSYAKGFNAFKDLASDYSNQLSELAAGKRTAIRKNGGFYDAENQTIKVDFDKCNSRAFMNMFNAMKAVNELTVNDSPAKICEAYHNLDIMSAAYEAKIRGQKFAAFTSNGKGRLALSVSLQEHAKRAIKELGKIPENMACNQSMEKQIESMTTLKNNIVNHIKPRLTEHFAEQKKEYIDKYLGDYVTEVNNTEDKNIILRANKDNLQKGLAAAIAISYMENTVNSNPTALFSCKDFSNYNLTKEINKLNNRYEFFSMIENVKGSDDYNRLVNMAKTNPKSLIDEMSKFKVKPKVEEPKNPVQQASGPNLNLI